MRGRPPSRRAARWSLPVLIALIALAATGCDSESEVASDDAPGPKVARAAPNVVVVMTDDQDVSTYERGMPITRKEIEGRGVSFKNSFVTTPLCCPARATFLTGQYGHNNGVLKNSPGYPAMVDRDNVLPVWLQRAGYRTAVAGKWLNGYDRAPESDGGRSPAPGWDMWNVQVSAQYYDYDLSLDGEVEHRGDGQGDHANAVVTAAALRFLREGREREEQPFFLWLPYAAPHRDKSRPPAGGACGEEGWAVPTPRDLRDAGPTSPPRSPAVNERSVDDKPAFVRRLRRLDGAGLDRIERAYGCELASLRSVDRAVGRLIAALRQSGELERTLVVFTSDNGFMHGEHRLQDGKNLPYAGSARVPLTIRPPGGMSSPVSVSLSQPVANIDLAPTILDYAGAEPCPPQGDCRVLDGISLRPLLEGREVEWPRDRALVLESEKGKNGVCKWTAVRTEGHLYTRYRYKRGGTCEQPGEGELYDLAADPHELRNRVRDRDARRVLNDRLKALERCAGAECIDG
jgi:arylsulfatase A-like enzyme